MKCSSIAAIAMLAIGCLPVAASGATYDFANIADNSGEFSDFIFGSPSLNATGTAAFTATRNGDPGLFTGHGGEIATIADSSGGFDRFGLVPSINSGGTVAFAANVTPFESGVFTGDGGGPIPIADSSGAFRSFTDPAINAGGAVAFHSFLDNRDAGIFLTSGGSTATIVDSDGPLGNFDLSVGLNSAGTVAFLAQLDSGGEGIFTGDGGAITTIADTSGEFSGFIRPAINDEVIVAFAASLDAGGAKIVTVDGGTMTTVADTSTFDELGPTAINAGGTVAFVAVVGGNLGIFTGDDPVGDKVIAEGDTLFGSTVISLNFSRGLNDNGQVAFSYELETGVQGIAVASVVPEPATWALVMLGGLVIMSGRRRFGRR